MKWLKKASRSVSRTLEGGFNAIGSGFKKVGKTVSGGVKRVKKAVGSQKIKKSRRGLRRRPSQTRRISRKSPSRYPRPSRSPSPRSRSSSPRSRSPSKRRSKGKSGWINHVKAYARANNISYGEALSAARASYRK